jgi:amino acid adenylation domain-containing protein
MSTTDRPLADLSPEEKRALLAQRLRQKEAAPRRFPLSFAQQRLWFLDRMEGGSAFYNISFASRLNGPLNVGALERGINEIVRRHDALRTSFLELNEQPVQVVSANLQVALPKVDLRGVPPDEQARRVAALSGREAAGPFDLKRAPLARVLLLQLGDEEHLFIVTMHHIIADGVSFAVFHSELESLYAAFTGGKPSPLPELPIQYGDYAAWQRRWLSGDTLQAQLDYWKGQLAGAPPLLELPADYLRPPAQTYKGAVESIIIPPDLLGKLETLGRKEGVTTFMTLLAAFETLLYRYTGQPDIVVGTPIANRTRPELEDLIGFFANTLVLRANLDGDPTFRELLGRVRETALDAYAHQDFPFERLVEELHPERNLSYNPVFQVMFGQRSAGKPAVEGSSVAFNPELLDGGTSILDLVLTVMDSPKGTQVVAEYSTDLFDAATIARLLTHYLTLLEGVAADSQRRISLLPMLGDEERSMLLMGWNDTEREYPSSRCMHHLIVEQAARSPDRVALVFGDRSLTYRELDEQSNRLARYLMGLGVGPETLVGICVERSVEMVVGVLGILKAGGAYVPLDPVYPQERLAYMLEHSATSVLLTQSELAGVLPPFGGRTVLLDTEWSAIEQQDASNPQVEVGPEDLAYVIYTSGSTGKPKGVMLPHRALTNHLWSMRQQPGLDEHDALLAVTSLSFDIAALELYLPLIAGATLVLASREVASDGVLLGKEISRRGVTAMQGTPATWRVLLVADAWPREMEGKLKVLCGGEALPVALAGELCKRAGSVWNMYGPTETCIWSAVFPVESPGGEAASSAAISIGRPIANTQIYLLDRQGQPVPIGVAGELFIGGDGLARGYLGRPDMTAERFVPDPFSAQPGARLYRTGDLARYLPDGNVEFIGRIDHQVKVRGFRIELGEIETALSRHQGVREAVVVVRDGADANDKRLVAYYVPQPGATITTAELRRHLQAGLPEYMVPSLFVPLDAMPLTPNGKVDRKALPAPGSIQQPEENTYQPPRTPVEEKLAEIWGGVLKKEQVGVTDNFFALGGHSLLATQVVSRVRYALDVELPLRSLFEAPTVAGLAERVEQAQQVESDRALKDGNGGAQQPALQPVSAEEKLPLSFAQQRLWLLDQLEPGSPAYNIPIPLRLRGPLDMQALKKSLGEIVRRHETLRTTFAPASGIGSQAGKPMQKIAPPADVDLRPVDLRYLPVDEREAAAQSMLSEEAQRPFDLETGPLFRVSLLRIGDEDHMLIANMHHSIADGWSIGIYMAELEALYGAFAAGQPSPLPDLPIQYGDYAAWQRKWLEGERLQTQLDYWRNQMRGAPPALNLPTDRPRPPMQTYGGSHLTFSLPGKLYGGLKELGQREGATFFMTLLAAFQALLYRYTGQPDVIVGSPIAGRTQAETEDMIGFFVNSLVLRTHLGDNPSFREALQRARETALGAYAHQDVPFERLVEALQPERDLSRSPLFQVMFMMESAPPAAPRLGDLRAEFVEMETGTSKFDLTLYLEEAGDHLEGSLEYNTALFDRPTIARMAGHFRTLLEGIIADPQARVAHLPLMPDVEQRLLSEWNDTHDDYPADRCVHELFKEQVERTPNATALIYGGREITYRQLDERADRLARHLRRLGVGPDVPVAVCMERSIDMVVSLLGALKAGGAYVPLDPAYPQERLAYMLRDSGAKVLISQQGLAGSIPSYEGRTVFIDAAWEEAGLELEERPEPAVTPGNAAYVMYTSGSTGQPKGVLGLHRGVVNRLSWMYAAYPFVRGEVCCQKTALSFIDSVWEVFGPLLAGVPSVILPDDTVGDVNLFVAALAQHKVTRLVLVPSLLRAILDGGHGLGELAMLKLWVASGESLPAELVTRFRQALPGAKLLNLYGSTEVAADVTWYDTACLQEGATSVPIGRPIANTQVYILDAYGHSVPVGVPGGVYVGGHGLARGYHAKPDQTGESFVPNPFSEEPGSRLYRMGDLGRFLPDGNIEFLGRADSQEKLRGIRIEPDEIAAHLSEHPAVRECVVLVREDRPGDARLVAYVVLHAPETAEAGDLRGFLQMRIPAFMVPSAFVFIEELALTPSGKVDRKALPPPTYAGAGGRVAPRDAIEAVLAGMWSSVLNIEAVGIYDNFFELGGHSLLATQLVSRIRQDLRADIILRQLFEHPTIVGLSEVLVAQETRPGRTLKIAQVLQQIEGMSDEAMSARLQEEQQKRGAP